MTSSFVLTTFILLASSLVAHASAAAPSLIGTWTSDCQAQERSSYQNQIQFMTSGEVINSNLNYADSSCQQLSYRDDSSALFEILEESDVRTLVKVSPSNPAEGEIQELVSDFHHEIDGTIRIKVIRGKVVTGGAPTEIPAEVIQALPATHYTRNR